jgi:hypothetical protein
MMLDTTERLLNGSDDLSDSQAQASTHRNKLTKIAKALLTEVSAQQVLTRTPRDIESDWKATLAYISVAVLQIVGAAYMYWCIAQSLELSGFLAWAEPSKPAWVIATPVYNLSIQIFFSILSSAIFRKLFHQVSDALYNFCSATYDLLGQFFPAAHEYFPDVQDFFSKGTKQGISEAFLNLIAQSVTAVLFCYLTIESVYGFTAMTSDAAENCPNIDASNDSEITFSVFTVAAFGLLMAPGVMKFVAALLHYSVDRMVQNISQTGLLKLIPFLDEFMLKHSRRQYKEMQVKSNIDEKMISLRAFLNANAFPDVMPKETNEDYTRYQALTNQCDLPNELNTIKNATAQWQRGEKLSDEDVIALHLSLETIKAADPYHANDNTITLPWHWMLFGLINIASVTVSSSVIWANLAGSEKIKAQDVALSIAVGAATLFIASSQFTKSLYVDATATAFTYAAAIFNKQMDRDRRYLRNILIPGAVLSSASIVALAVKNYGNNPILLTVVLWSTIVNNGAGIGKQLSAASAWNLCRSTIHQDFDFLLALASISMYLPSKFFDFIDWLFAPLFWCLGSLPAPAQSARWEKDVAQLELMQSLSELLEQGITNSTPDNTYAFLEGISNISKGIPSTAVGQYYTQKDLAELNTEERKTLSLPTSMQATANCSSWLMQAIWFSVAKSELGLGFSFKEDALMYGVAALLNIVPQLAANLFEDNKSARPIPQLIEASLLVAIIGFVTSITAEYGGHFLKHKDLNVGSENEFDGVFTLFQCLSLSLLAMHCMQFAPPMAPVTNYIGSFFEAEKAEMDYAFLGDVEDIEKVRGSSDLYANRYLGVSAHSVTSVDSAGDTPVFM